MEDGLCMYDGEFTVPFGTVVYDDVIKVWAVRAAEEHTPYPCGEGCCGILIPAVAAFESEEEARRFVKRTS